MVSKSLKEKAVFSALGILVLYAGTIGWWFLASSSRSKAVKRYEDQRAVVMREKKMISEKKLWEERYEEEASLVPLLDEAQSADTVWMRVIGDIASMNNVFISDIKPGTEEIAGDMLETSVDIKWTGAVESLVKFMYALENTDKGKFDVQSLSFSSGKRKGFMSGSMTLVCIFKR